MTGTREQYNSKGSILKRSSSMGDAFLTRLKTESKSADVIMKEREVCYYTETFKEVA